MIPLPKEPAEPPKNGVHEESGNTSAREPVDPGTVVLSTLQHLFLSNYAYQKIKLLRSLTVCEVRGFPEFFLIVHTLVWC